MANLNLFGKILAGLGRPLLNSKMTNTRKYKIAAISGDQIGKEVMPECLRVLDVAAKRLMDRRSRAQMEEFLGRHESSLWKGTCVQRDRLGQLGHGYLINVRSVYLFLT